MKYSACFCFMISTQLWAAGSNVPNKDLPEVELPINETSLVENYAKKVGAFQNTSGFKASFWCEKLKAPVRKGSITTEIECKWIALE